MNETDNTNLNINSEEEALASLHKLEDNARAMLRLQSNEDFKSLFEKGYVIDWAITQTANVSVYQPERRIRVMEQMLARSIFMEYCNTIIENGKQAVETLRQIKEEEQLGNEPTE